MRLNIMRHRKNKTLEVIIDPTDQNVILSFMVQELKYYNSLVGSFNPRCMAFPETLLDLTPEWIKLFGVIAYSGESIKKLEFAKPDVELPSSLEKYRHMLVGRDEKGQRVMTETLFSIMSIAATQASIHPSVRKNLALEVLNHYREQAKRVANRLSNNSDQVYKVSPEMLQEYDFSQKRHLQLPRSKIHKIVWNEIEEHSEIYHCYGNKPIIVPQENLTNNNNWNYLIIHQKPGPNINRKTPWIIDILFTPQPYLLKYLDSIRPNTSNAFYIAKSR